MGSNQKKKKKNKACSCESRLKPHLPILQLLSMPKYSSKLKNEVLKHCSNDCILKICEIAYNLLKGNVPLKSSQKKKTRASETHLEAPRSTTVSTETQTNFIIESKRRCFPSHSPNPQFTVLKS